MLGLLKDRKFRKAKDRRDADELIRAHGTAARAHALAMAAKFERGSREERHWARMVKLIDKR